MAWRPVAETAHLRVANLANSPAIGCDSRLDMVNFIPQSAYPRINQRFLKLFCVDDLPGPQANGTIPGSMLISVHRPRSADSLQELPPFATDRAMPLPGKYAADY
jgi:hypothetical protein